MIHRNSLSCEAKLLWLIVNDLTLVAQVPGEDHLVAILAAEKHRMWLKYFRQKEGIPILLVGLQTKEQGFEKDVSKLPIDMSCLTFSGSSNGDQQRFILRLQRSQVEHDRFRVSRRSDASISVD